MGLAELSILTSFHYFKKVRLADLERKKFPGIKLNIFADSGGFSAMTLGVPVRLTEYVRWLRANEASIAVYANLDVIGDAEKTRRNQAILEGEGLRPIPVFHVGSDFWHLDEMVERYDYLAIGGMVPYVKEQKGKLANWIRECFARTEPKGVRVHGFGITTSWDLAKGFPWYSLDSSSWTSVFQFRVASVFDAARGEFAQVDFTDRHAGFKHARLLRDYGFTPGEFYRGGKYSYEKAGALSILSVLRAEQWLRARRAGGGP